MQDAISYLGIDPGKMGGAAVITLKSRSDSKAIVSAAFKFKDKTDHEIAEFFSEVNDQYNIQKCYMEKVASSPQMGVVSAFTFGDGNGFLRGQITAYKIPHEFITPATWQRELKCLTKGKKSVSRAKAQQLFADQLKITDGNADAILIAYFCSRKERGLC